MEIEVKYLKANCGVRYWENATVNGVEDEHGDLIPCKEEDRWMPLIELETGQILNWNTGTEADIHYKVCDDGIYTLLDAEKKPITEIEYYVPNIMCPEGQGFGDYVIMKVNKYGVIQNWSPSFDEFHLEENCD